MERPQRRYQLTLSMGADDWHELLHALEQLHLELYMRAEPIETNHNTVSGGPCSGYVLDIRVDPAMDHERYVSELNACIAAMRTERDAAGDAR